MITFNPYAGVNWSEVAYLHSCTHQHVAGEKCKEKLEALWQMGIHHLPVSNYYPSRPVYPLPADFMARHPDALAAPNAEQHSTCDRWLHFNAVGSHYTTGYGETPPFASGQSPLKHTFEGLTAYDTTSQPWRGVYRLDVAITQLTDKPATVTLSVSGAIHTRRPDFPDLATVDENGRLTFTLDATTSLLFKASTTAITIRLDFDPALLQVTRFRLMQGTNRPWRDAFRAALDGTACDADGTPLEGLRYPDGGGITINHPLEPLAGLLDYFDFDERVLGVEIWNNHRCFGYERLEDGTEQRLAYYSSWDAILRSGRRCFAFCVKDHCTYGRGRNVLLLPADLSDREALEHAALRAYRQGAFFGHVGAMTVDDAGNPAPPYDYGQLRFSAIELNEGDAAGAPTLAVRVAGADPLKRPSVQIRFITDQGVAAIVAGDEASFELPLDSDGKPACRYLRIEAFAWPPTLANGTKMTHEHLATLDVGEIADLTGVVFSDGNEPPMSEWPGSVEMIFSQPILFSRHG